MGPPMSHQHVPQDMAGPGLGVPARPSGLSFLSDPGHRDPPGQEGRWGVMAAARPRAPPMSLREMGLGPAAPCPAAHRPASPAFLSPPTPAFSLLASCLHVLSFPPAPSFSLLASLLLSSCPSLSLHLPHLLSTLTPVSFFSSRSRETLSKRLKVKPDNEV